MEQDIIHPTLLYKSHGAVCKVMNEFKVAQ